ncbi:MAG: cytochrome P450 [Deltaproteobacteria bacterium]|nr:cytochrome P450 [Deltaproteobacteria bacterium]
MAITTGLELLDPTSYGANGPPHEIWKRLRAESPVHWCEVPEIEPFWAITRHEDIRFISRQPDIFISGKGITPLPRDPALNRNQGVASMRVVISTDPPEHRDLRKVASPWFTSRSLRSIDPAILKSAKELVDELAKDGGEGETNLASGIAVRHPLRILASALGVPEEGEAKILELSNRLFAPDDEDLGAGRTPEDFARLGQEFLELFLPIIADRRANPTDDLASLLANGQINGQAMGPAETLGYYLIVFNAGHDTTKNALAGGFRALIEHPDAFDAVKSDPNRSSAVVEEILRWTSSVNYMKRTAACDTEVNGQKIREGEAVMMFYGSANRDESVFENPYSFDIDRSPNNHLAFGYAEHFCMGAHLARRSMRAIVEELARRVEHWEIIGEPEWISASFVVGLKNLPVRYRIRPG